MYINRDACEEHMNFEPQIMMIFYKKLFHFFHIQNIINKHVLHILFNINYFSFYSTLIEFSFYEFELTPS